MPPLKADRLAQKDIGTEHLRLGLLDAESCYAAQLVCESAAEAAKLRVQFAARLHQQWLPFQHYEIQVRGLRAAAPHESVEIHGSSGSLDCVFDAFKRCREYNWHGHKAAWLPRDIAIDRKTGRFSLDLRLVNSANFTFVKGCLKKGSPRHLPVGILRIERWS